MASSRSILEKVTNTIYNNLQEVGLDLNSKKTVLIHFNRRGIKPQETEIKIKEVKIKSSNTVRFWGSC